MEPRDYYSVQRNPSLVPILRQINAVHIVTPYFSKIHLNIILDLQGKGRRIIEVLFRQTTEGTE
jgi:hypothetical protein